MNSLTKKVRKVKTCQRSLRIGATFNGVLNVVITDAYGDSCGYHIKPIPVDFGRGFQFDKYEAQEAAEGERTYHVHLDKELGDSCTCKGFIYRSKCKHVDCVRKLVALGKV